MTSSINSVPTNVNPQTVNQKNFIKSEVQGLFQRYAVSNLFYRAPQAISFVGSTLINTAISTASLASSLILNTEDHIPYVAPIPLWGDKQEQCPALLSNFNSDGICTNYPTEFRNIFEQNYDYTLKPLPTHPSPLFPDAHTCGVFSALTLPVSQTITYTSKKVLGCNENTWKRNWISKAINYLATPTTTAFVAKSLGYEIEPKAIFDHQTQIALLGLKLVAVKIGLDTGLAAYNNLYNRFAKKFEDIEDPTLKDIAASVSSVATVAGLGLSTTLGLGYSLGYSSGDMSNAAVSLAASLIPVIGFSYLMSQAQELAKEAANTAMEMVDQSDEPAKQPQAVELQSTEEPQEINPMA